MGFGKNKGSSECPECRGENGNHRGKCSQDPKRQAMLAANARAERDFDRKADEFIMKHPHGSPHYTPNPFPGVTCENRPDQNGRYHYTRR
jgi:hypothetical protein